MALLIIERLPMPGRSRRPHPALDALCYLLNGQARSTTDSAIEARVKVLMQPSYDEFSSDAIDEVELKRRKHAAREKARSEHAHRSKLDDAFAAYTAAAEARVAAFAAYTAAEAKEEAALAAVYEALAPLEPGASGAVKRER